MSCFQHVLLPASVRWISAPGFPISRLCASVPLLCESNQVANQGACSACFRCFSVCSCNMNQYDHCRSPWFGLTPDTWHDLTGIAMKPAVGTSKSEVAFWIFHQRIQKTGNPLKSPTSLGKIDWLISRHRQIPRHSRQVSTGSRSLPSLCGFKGGFSVIKTSVDRSGSSSWGLILKPT